MRAIAITEPGDEDVLKVVERPTPDPGAQQIRVRVMFAGVNRADLLQRRGLYPAPPGAPPDIPGLEYAGVVDAVGPAATALRPGDEVYGIVPGGAYADYVIVHEREAAKVPSGLTLEQAAAIPEAFITAYDALVLRGGLTPGERVLVHAAGSGVGTAAVQVAKALGCNVTGTSRTAEKLERARELGLDVALHVPSNDALEATLTKAEPFDVALDLVGGPYLPATLPAMASKGRVVLVGLTGGPFAGVNLATVLTKRLTIVGTVLRSRPLEEKIQAADLLRRTLTPWLGRGKIKPVVERTFAFADAPDAHRLVASNATFGKVLLSMTT
ncbi:MAG: NAD(P)H-quinone oxidoreductase [Polyangiaceae bacterium]|jgi:NADPH2:quinone reductase|nr:NAD(P)H-quinone oxidoreductase [Polyangiaceae bacterium]